MSEMDEAVYGMDASLFVTFGTPLTIIPQTGDSYTATGIIDHNVEQFGEYGEVKGTVSTVSFTRNAVPNLKAGDRIAMNENSWTVDRLEEDDGFVVKYTLESI